MISCVVNEPYGEGKCYPDFEYDFSSHDPEHIKPWGIND
jgi:hypothetical protein